MTLDPLRLPVGERFRPRGASRPRRSARVAPEPTFYSRYECKYTVDPAVLPAMRDFLRPFTQPDEFAIRHKGYRYPVCSLYLDSPDLILYQQTVGGEKDRFKLRVRTYDDDPASPAFLEVKRKVNSVVHKRRAGLPRAQVRDILQRRVLEPPPTDAADRRDAEYFLNHVALTEARPIVRVKYMREAYQGVDNEPVRVTIDTDLMHAITFDDDLRHAAGRWMTTSTDGVIVEVKFTERFPSWVQDFVRAFALGQRAVPKYVLSVDHMLLAGRESALALAGVTLPPIRRA